MVGTRDLTRLADLVDRALGKLVLVGDTEQLSEIDAGGAFRALVAAQDGVELTEVTRQRDPAARRQLELIRAGEGDAALSAMRDAGNLVLSPTAEHTRATIVADRHCSHQRARTDGPAFMVAKRNADVRDLNHRARDILLDDGQLGDHAVVLGGRELREGERVVAGVNNRHVGVRNGTTGTLQHIDRDSQTLHVRTDRGADLAIPFDYAQGRTERGRPHIDYAYALTVHRAQGDTWGAAHYLGGEDTYRQEAYTALSRARHTLRFYATTDTRDSEPTLARALQRDNAKTLALEALNGSPIAHHHLRRTPPSHITSAIGTPPNDPTGHAIWTTAAVEIDRYRQAVALAPETSGLGPRPERAADYRRWQQATMRLHQLTRQLDARLPARDRAPDLSIER
jgi:ATP-dependent exoDNAse (exonuclease V) alpha subunit